MVIDSDMIGNNRLLNSWLVLSMLKMGLISIFIIKSGRMVGNWMW